MIKQDSNSFQIEYDETQNNVTQEQMAKYSQDSHAKDKIKTNNHYNEQEQQNEDNYFMAATNMPQNNSQSLSQAEQSNVQSLKMKIVEQQAEYQEANDNEQVFLRDDVNQLFDHLGGKANYNLKKYKQNKFVSYNNEVRQKRKKHSKNLTIKQCQFQGQEQITSKMNTEPVEFFCLDEIEKHNKKRFKKVQTQKNQDETMQSEKSAFIKTGNFEKLMKKNQQSTTVNRFKVPNSNHSNKLNMTSTALSRSKRSTQVKFPPTEKISSVQKDKFSKNREGKMTYLSSGRQKSHSLPFSLQKNSRRSIDNIRENTHQTIENLRKNPTQLQGQNKQNMRMHTQQSRKNSRQSSLKKANIQGKVLVNSQNQIKNQLRNSKMTIENSGVQKNKTVKINQFGQNTDQGWKSDQKKRLCQQVKLEKQIQKNNFEKLEKKYNKHGPLKFKHIENWMNNIIQEYCHQQYFDSSLTNPALKKYYIDSNSLMSNGVQPKDVDRIYNSLFVYSMGFNNLIKEISKGNRQLVKNIWRVFSLLLEYCAAGNYETMIGEMQRDKIRKIEALKQEIEKRQSIIQRNQQINEQKNNSVFKELKRLKDENINLSNQRQILMQDFQQADQAFNQEVNLRLKFENTINQIYGVHKQLSNKHGRLYYDFTQKVEELKKASEKFLQQTKTTQSFKYQLIEIKQKYNELSKVNSHDKQHIDVLLQEVAKLKQKNFLIQKQLQSSKYLNVQMARKLEQANVQLKNNKVIIELREKSAKETHSEYQITLQENNKLYGVISDQRLQMEGLLKEKKEFNQNVLKILADSSYYKKKLDIAEKRVSELTKKTIQLETQIHRVQVKNDIQLKDIDSYKQDLDANYQNIKKMHQRNFEMEQELLFLRKFQDNMDKLLGQKNEKINNLNEKLATLQQQLFESNQDKLNLMSRNKILQTQLKAQQQNNLKKLSDINKQKDSLSNKETSLSIMLSQTQAQLERYIKLFNDVLMNYKNEKFQRNNLSLAYEQILKVLQKKNAQAKQMAIQNNQLTEEVSQYKQKYKLTYLNLMDTTEQLTKKINKLTLNNQDLSQKVANRKQFYHPMIVEDLIERLNINQKNYKKLDKQFQGYKSKTTGQRLRLQRKIKEDELKYQEEKEAHAKQMKNLKERNKQQIQYQINLRQVMKKRLTQLEIMEKTFQKAIQENERVGLTHAEKQKSYLKSIQDKQNKITELNRQIEKIRDQKDKQIQSISKQAQKAQQQKINFVHEFKTKKQRQLRQEVQKIYQQEISSLKKSYQQIKNDRIMSSLGEKSDGQSASVLKRYIEESIKTKSIQQILSLKQQNVNSPDQFYEEIQRFYRSGKSQSIDIFNKTKYFNFQSQSQKREKSIKEKLPAYLIKDQQSPQQKKRSQMSRKMKISFDYYSGQNK